jgi:hypothetical protein
MNFVKKWCDVVVSGKSGAISRNLHVGEWLRISGNPLRSIPETPPVFNKIYLYLLSALITKFLEEFRSVKALL